MRRLQRVYVAAQSTLDRALDKLLHDSKHVPFKHDNLFIMKNKSVLVQISRFLYYKVLFGISIIVNDILKSKTLIMFPTRNFYEIYNDFKLISNHLSPFELIRIGPKNDGGYYLPKILNSQMVCFSPGYGGIKQFEDHLSTLGITSYICDFNYDQIDDLKNNQHFSQFQLVANKDLKAKVLQKTLDEWIEESKIKDGTDLLLQMDIEGGEYEVIKSLEEVILDKFSILIIEFHNLENLFVSNEFSKTFNDVINKLVENFRLINLQVNNAGGYINHNFLKFPKVIELTFLKEGIYDKNKNLQLNETVTQQLINDPKKPTFKYPF